MLSHIAHFAAWSYRNNDYDIPKFFVLEFSKYKIGGN